jgi:hypothetical protein
VSRTTGGPAEVLREGSGIKVGGTADDGLAISTYIKDAGNLPWQKTSPGLIYRQRALSDEFSVRAATGTSFLPTREFNLRGVSKGSHEIQFSTGNAG